MYQIPTINMVDTGKNVRYNVNRHREGGQEFWYARELQEALEYTQWRRFKEVIALGQTYFAIKTRQQELIEDYEQLSEDQKRLAIRNEIKAHNKSLAEAAKMLVWLNLKIMQFFRIEDIRGCMVD